MEAPRTPGSTLVRATDRLPSVHQAVLSWAEIDPDFARRPVVPAICRDGVALELCGLRLVVPYDRCGSRYVSTVTHIWIGAQRDAEVAR